jgi:hypothetical protein
LAKQQRLKFNEALRIVPRFLDWLFIAFLQILRVTERETFNTVHH